MSFAKAAADVVTDHPSFRQLAKEAQAIVFDQEDDPNDERRQSRMRSLLWTLGGLGALGAGAYGLHRSGALNAMGDWFRPAAGQPGEVGTTQRAFEALRDLPSTGPDIAGIPLGTYGLGGLAAGAAASGLPAARRRFPGNRQMLARLSPDVSPYGARGMARYLRNSPNTTPIGPNRPHGNWLDLLRWGGERDVNAARAAGEEAFANLPEAVRSQAGRTRLAGVLENLLDEPGQGGTRNATQQLLSAYLSTQPGVKDRQAFEALPLDTQVSRATGPGTTFGRSISAQARDIDALTHLDRAIDVARTQAQGTGRDAQRAQNMLSAVADELGINVNAEADQAVRQPLEQRWNQYAADVRQQVDADLTDARARNPVGRLSQAEEARVQQAAEASVRQRWAASPEGVPTNPATVSLDPAAVRAARAAAAARELENVQRSVRRFNEVPHPYSSNRMAARRGIGALLLPALGWGGASAAEWMGNT